MFGPRLCYLPARRPCGASSPQGSRRGPDQGSTWARSAHAFHSVARLFTISGCRAARLLRSTRSAARSYSSQTSDMSTRASIVRQEQDERVVEHASRLQTFDQHADAGIDRLHHRGIDRHQMIEAVLCFVRQRFPRRGVRFPRAERPRGVNQTHRDLPAITGVAQAVPAGFVVTAMFGNQLPRRAAMSSPDGRRNRCTSTARPRRAMRPCSERTGTRRRSGRTSG